MKKLSLYIHIPFCKTICLYCNFLTFAHKSKFIPQYVEALKNEIRIKSAALKEYRVETIYFGGGTPSLIEVKYIEEILQTLEENFKIDAGKEVSIECNPESVEEAKLKQYFDAGITRISLGIQNFDRKVLFRIARPHDDKTIFKALEAIRQSPFRNFGADFIIGLPHQSLEHFKKQLETVLEQQIPHLSFYFLSYDTKKIDLFKADCPNDDLQIEMYQHLIRTLKNAGYIHYEVSNYAKPGFECRHNLRYWNQREYQGFGLGAHSYLNSKCTENTTDFDRYLLDPTVLQEEITIDPELHELEYIMLHLRSHQGIDTAEYETKFGKCGELLKKAEPYLETKRLALEKGRLKSTEQGFLILDAVTTALL
jgi:oxygen-independent coproporphyrinogen-3 oxidase